jgi:hypothetical protein
MCTQKELEWLDEGRLVGTPESSDAPPQTAA